MELMKRNIHMNKLKCQSSVQWTLDDDFNVPDVKPDIDKIIKEQGDIELTEIKPVNGKLLVKGILKFNVLYSSEEDERPIHNITGELPFDEVVNMDEVCAEDVISVKWELEDLSTSLINSRKISLKSIIGFKFIAEEIYDEETAVAVTEEEGLQSRNKTIHITQIAIHKKDTFRIKDEVNLPANKPNIFELLYYQTELRNTDIRLLDDKINLKGELVLFLLYAGEDEEKPIQYFETEIPYSGFIDCPGCKEEMTSNIGVRIHSKDLDIKPDSDGEERILDAEIILDLDMKVYEEEELDILKDLYSTGKELILSRKDAFYENLLVKNNSKMRVNDKIMVEEGNPTILQICNAAGQVKIDDMNLVDNGIQVEGIVEIQILYVTEEDRKPLNSLKGIIPFSQIVEVKGITDHCIYDLKPSVEQISVILMDSREIEAKASITLDTIVFEKMNEPIITDLQEESLDAGKIQSIPSMVGYMVKPEDSLWDIGKKYYTTVEQIQILNDLESENVKTGDKLLLVKQLPTF